VFCFCLFLQGDELIDADVSRRMLQLAMMMDRRHDPATVAALGRADVRLELALLSFMDKLKQGLLYVDAHSEGEEKEPGAPSAGIPQLLSSIIGRRAPGIPPEVYTNIFKRIGLGDHKEVLGLLMQKVRRRPPKRMGTACGSRTAPCSAASAPCIVPFEPSRLCTSFPLIGGSARRCWPTSRCAPPPPVLSGHAASLTPY